jgi:hypothetical protein
MCACAVCMRATAFEWLILCCFIYLALFFNSMYNNLKRKMFQIFSHGLYLL